MLDCTFGGGNHSYQLLQAHPRLRVVGLDLDSRVMDKCREHYSHLIVAKRLALEHSNFVHAGSLDPRALFNKRIGIKERYDIALMDLGFSSYQLEARDRGFSYIGPDEQPLCMRFDSEQESGEYASAADIINNTSELELSEIFKKFGEERFHDQLAKKVVEARRAQGMIKTTGDFKNIIREGFMGSGRDEKNSMIKRAFQAVRIATNYELMNLSKFLEEAPSSVMDKGSLMLIITFHSLEEKIVS